MSENPPTLHLLCGKIAAGKSTLAAKLVAIHHAVLISEDQWLDTLYGREISSLQDYVEYSGKLKKIMGPHIVTLLSAGVSVVLDFPANTLGQRKWMLDILNSADVSHQMHFLAIPDEVCLSRLRERNAKGEHPFATTEQEFRKFSEYFQPPTEEEGFNITHYDH